MANVPSVSNRIYYSTEFKKTLAAMFVCVAMTLVFLAVTEPVLADNSPTPACQVCHTLNNGKSEVVTLPCSQVAHYLAQHSGSCAGPCPCHVTGVQNP